jgi:3-phosphoshikimate 1-carboxyvinyltransferase
MIVNDSVDNFRPNHGAVVVTPINRVRGELGPPGDKSISHRAAMLGALARGQSTLKNFSSAQDCLATLACLEALGVRLTRKGSTVVIDGAEPDGFHQPAQSLDAQNSGTTMRLLAGILAGQPLAATITGDDSLCKRPMLRVAEPLRLMGAQVEVDASGGAPLSINGRRPLRSIHYQLPIASAQIKSAVLLAGLAADGITSVKEPSPTRDHTERLLPEFGAQVKRNGNTISIQGGVKLNSQDLVIPGDISSAAFFIAAAVALPGSELLLRDVGLNPTRTAFLAVLRDLGATINVLNERIEAGEPVGTIQVRGTKLKNAAPMLVSGAAAANLIDELPLLAFLSAGLGLQMKLSDAKELRVKESDRIFATVENLSRMGASIVECADGWQLLRGKRLHSAQLTSFGDHRIAMACAVATLVASGPSTIEGAQESVAVSLPEFWTLLESVTE